MSKIYKPPLDPLDIIYEDAEFVIVNKPSGLLSVPGKGKHLSDCLLERLKLIFPDALLVHRLDRDTSGLIIFALTKFSQRHISLQFEKRQIKKAYVADVWGKLDKKRGVVNLPLIVDWPNRPMQHVDHEIGKELGHPSLGDPFYATGKAADFPRLMLHAESLRFNHPNGGKGVQFKVVCPF